MKHKNISILLPIQYPRTISETMILMPTTKILAKRYTKVSWYSLNKWFFFLINEGLPPKVEGRLKISDGLRALLASMLSKRGTQVYQHLNATNHNQPLGG